MSDALMIEIYHTGRNEIRRFGARIVGRNGAQIFHQYNVQIQIRTAPFVQADGRWACDNKTVIRICTILAISVRY